MRWLILLLLAVIGGCLGILYGMSGWAGVACGLLCLALGVVLNGGKGRG